jgi:FKBP-type peptidyl-prolyl cis-trans isomerase FkpA
MKIKLLMNLSIAVMLALVISSCLKTEEDEKVYTAAEEILLREAYLDTLAARGHDIDTLENEIYYVMMDDEGEGDPAKAGDTLTVGYAGYFIDGVLFDSSELSSPNGKMTFILEHEEYRMIPGFEAAMKVLNKGARAQFVIPSAQAYGSNGSGRIPPYQTLIFVIKMYEIKPS